MTEPTVDPVTEPATPTTEAGLGDAPIGPTEAASVVRVVDGDTIVIDRGNGPEKLRYIGVDTPETVKPGSPVEFMGKEASAANAALVDGRQVLLERDISEYDRYDRLLRYVWVEDASSPSGWLLVNLALVARGYAQVVTYPPDVRYVDLYLAAQRQAREEGLGLWGCRPGRTAARPRPCVPRPRPRPTRATATRPTRTCASRRHRPTSTARTSRTGASASWHRTRTASTGTTTASDARAPDQAAPDVHATQSRNRRHMIRKLLMVVGGAAMALALVISPATAATAEAAELRAGPPDLLRLAGLRHGEQREPERRVGPAPQPLHLGEVAHRLDPPGSRRPRVQVRLVPRSRPAATSRCTRARARTTPPTATGAQTWYIWNNTGDTATLKNAAGALQDSCRFSGGRQHGRLLTTRPTRSSNNPAPGGSDPGGSFMSRPPSNGVAARRLRTTRNRRTGGRDDQDHAPPL